ncbi:hypothetical protein TNCV_1017861 [Trichonephila clavipes]|uniref:Uncharacterized protein n=1 Tax=Trichonephila clavipes TaxID=2585209 RepID=A0A8X6VYA9_TRICX|nr:hypothetical protein TNCV_1017861 [Trichonephila clavipes]
MIMLNIESEHNSRKEHLKPDIKNVILNSLVEPNNVFLIPLHTKIVMMKQFAKAITRRRRLFQIPLQKVFWFIRNKVEQEGTFVGPDTRKVMKDKEFKTLP